MSDTILVYVEDPAEELSQQAVRFARALGGQPVLVGIEDPAGYAPSGWARALAQAVGERDARALIAPGSDRGNELAAHVGALADLPVAANCISLELGQPARALRVRWGGSLLEEALVHGAPVLATVAPHAVAAEPIESEIVRLAAVDDGAPRVAERIAAQAGGVSLAQAEVVVGGGRGVGSAEGFASLEELAGLLGAALGCSRAVTMAGWRPHSDQIGQTGTKIAPELYIAAGISGATQHMAGCKGAKRLLAINSDREASILAHADYAVIGDLQEVVPAICEQIRRVRQPS
jgi:electron transfer flavoprotein alpha subunit